MRRRNKSEADDDEGPESFLGINISIDRFTAPGRLHSVAADVAMLTLGEESSRTAEAGGGVPSEAGAKVPLRGRGRGRWGRGRVPAAPLGGGAGRVPRGGNGLHEQDEASPAVLSD